MDLFIATLIVACFAEVLARHRTFIIPADHRMLAIHVVFFFFYRI